MSRRLQWAPAGRRPLVRPRMRWRNNLQADLRNMEIEYDLTLKSNLHYESCGAKLVLWLQFYQQFLRIDLQFHNACGWYGAYSLSQSMASYKLLNLFFKWINLFLSNKCQTLGSSLYWGIHFKSMTITYVFLCKGFFWKFWVTLCRCC